MNGDTGGGIGLAVRRARHARGLTLAQAAGRIGKSKAWLSMIENGQLPLERRSDIAALAEALEVSADSLIGQPAPEIQRGQAQWNLVPLREVLLDAGLDDPPDIPARTVPDLAELVGDMDAALRKADYDTMLARMPTLLGELQVQAVATDGADREAALRLLVLAGGSASIMLRHFGATDLGWIAAERGRQAARLLDDPVWEGAAAYEAAHARSSSNKPRALLVAPRIADGLESAVGGDRLGREVYGMLRLSAALACAVQGDHAGAAAQSAEAARVAALSGEDRKDAFELFGVANVGVWQTSLAVEAGNAEEALEHAAGVNPRALASSNRRAALRMERARALAMLGGSEKTAEAITELRRAERLSPAQVHNTPLVRELVTYLLDRARREAGGRDLRGLAWRMGVI
jgi:transcriptional regulator with XRE-family HTH domain